MKKVLTITMIVLVLMALPTGSAAGQHIDVTWYDLALTVDPGGTPELRGQVATEGWARASLQAVTLGLSSHLQVRAVRDAEGTELAYTHADGALHVTYPLSAGDRFRFTVAYDGTPVSSGFGSWQTGTVSSGAYFWTLSEPYGASDWWPNNNHPSDKADSVRVSVRAPDPIRVGSNGLLVSSESHGDGTTTWTWEHHYPIASYLVSLAAGTYDVYEQLYIRPPALAGMWGPLEMPILHYAFSGSPAFEGINDFSGWREVIDMMPLFETGTVPIRSRTKNTDTPTSPSRAAWSTRP
jgi:aminopeptidase N